MEWRTQPNDERPGEIEWIADHDLLEWVAVSHALPGDVIFAHEIREPGWYFYEDCEACEGPFPDAESAKAAAEAWSAKYTADMEEASRLQDAIQEAAAGYLTFDIEKLRAALDALRAAKG